MNDFSILSGLQKFLRKQIPSQQVYLTVPPTVTYPCCVMELEEIWSNLRVPGVPYAKVKLKITCFSTSVGEAENLAQSSAIQTALDGYSVDLDQDATAILRHVGTVCEEKETVDIKAISLFYEALIRRKL